MIFHTEIFHFLRYQPFLSELFCFVLLEYKYIRFYTLIPYLLKDAINESGFAVICTQEGTNPLRIAFRTEAILDQAQQ